MDEQFGACFGTGLRPRQWREVLQHYTVCRSHMQTFFPVPPPITTSWFFAAGCSFESVRKSIHQKYQNKKIPVITACYLHKVQAKVWYCIKTRLYSFTSEHDELPWCQRKPHSSTTSIKACSRRSSSDDTTLLMPRINGHFLLGEKTVAPLGLMHSNQMMENLLLSPLPCWQVLRFTAI